MPCFDRTDICEAYFMLECDWNIGGWLHERPSNVRRGEARGYVGEATHVQLARMRFKPSPMLDFERLSENAREIYYKACREWGLKMGQCDRCTSDAVTHFGEGDGHEQLCGECYEVVSREIDPVTKRFKKR